MDSIPIFVFKKHHNLKKTFLIQEMLKSNILAANIIYVSTSHTDKILKKYFKKLDNIFKSISELSIKKLKKKINGRETFVPMNRIN